MPVRLAAALALGDEGLETLVRVVRSPDADDASLRPRDRGARRELPSRSGPRRSIARAADGRPPRERPRVRRCARAHGRARGGPPLGGVVLAGRRGRRRGGAGARPHRVRRRRRPRRRARQRGAGRARRGRGVARARGIGRVRAGAARRGRALRRRRDGAAPFARPWPGSTPDSSGAEPGQLSLAAGGAGELSLASEEGGALSVVGGGVSAAGADAIGVVEGEAGGETAIDAIRPPQRPGTIQGKT